MNRISPLNYSTIGASGSSPEEEGHSAHDSAQGEMTISQDGEGCMSVLTCVLVLLSA
jgi:hypothetical protein